MASVFAAAGRLIGRETIGGRGFWSAIEAAAAPISSLLVSAALIKLLGSSEFGVLVAFLAISNLSLTINPAIAATTTKLISETMGRGCPDSGSVTRVIVASVMLVMSLGVIFFSIVVFAGKFVPEFLLGKGGGANEPQVRTMLHLTVALVCGQQVDNVFGASIKGLERFKQQALFEVASRMSTTVAVVMVAWLSGNILRVLLTNFLLILMSSILRGVVLYTQLPRPRRIRLPRLSDVRRILGFGSWMWLNATAGGAYGTVDRIVVARLLGPAPAAAYHIYIQLGQLVHYIPNSIFSFILPVISRLGISGKNLIGEIRLLYKRVSYLVLICAVIIGILLVIGQPIIVGRLLGKSGVDPGGYAFFTLILGFVLLAANISSYYLLLGLGRSKVVSLVSTGSIVLSLIFFALLIPRFGLEGAACARCIYGAISLWMVSEARSTLEKF